MKKRLITLFMGMSILLTACNLTSAPPEVALGEEVIVRPGGSVYFDSKTGDVFTSDELKLAPQGFSLTLCTFKWNNVHRTYDALGNQEIKGDWTGSCPSSADSYYLDPNPSMLKRNAFGSYVSIAPKKVIGRKKFVGSGGASWIRTEVFTTVPCVNGSYKSRIDFVATNPDGVALSQKLATGVSTAYSITTCN